MLSAKILNSQAKLNDFDIVGSIKFIPGESVPLVIRLFQPDRVDELRYVPQLAATLEISLMDTTGSETTKTMTVNSDDRSIWSTILTPTETETLAGGILSFTLTEGITVTKGFVENAITRNILGC